MAEESWGHPAAARRALRLGWSGLAPPQHCVHGDPRARRDRDRLGRRGGGCRDPRRLARFGCECYAASSSLTARRMPPSLPAGLAGDEAGRFRSRHGPPSPGTDGAGRRRCTAGGARDGLGGAPRGRGGCGRGRALANARRSSPRAAGQGEAAPPELQIAAERSTAAARRARDAAERELRKLGRHVHRRSRKGTGGTRRSTALSEREHEVARLVVDRKTNPRSPPSSS